MSNFINNDNKGFIWDILMEQKLFEGIDQKYNYDIKHLFEQTILSIENQKKNISLVEKNKEVIKLMVIGLDKFKSKQSQLPIKYTNTELHEEREKKFKIELKRKQTEFDGLNKSIPEKIDFSDTLDEKIGDKMDVLLAEIISNREKLLNQSIITHNTEIATKWIENGDTNLIENTEKNQTLKNLKIGNDTQIQDNQIVNLDKKTKVTFNEYNNKIHNFSSDSSPISISINEKSNINNNIANNNINNNIANNNDIQNNYIDDIDNNFFKNLKPNIHENTKIKSEFEYEPISNSNDCSNKLIDEIDTIKREMNEINDKLKMMESKQEEILFILKSIVKL
jgi:hypothetical protein